jgi:hypothetical protein
VNSQPRVLQQVFCLPRRRRLAPEKSQQGGAERGDQDGRRLWIGLLVRLHPAIQSRTSPSDLTVLSQGVLHLRVFATTERQVTLVIRILKKIRKLINPRYHRTADSNISGEQVLWLYGLQVQPSHALIDRPVEKGGTDMGRVPSITLQWKVTALARIGLSACGQKRRLIGNGLPDRGGPASAPDRPRTHYLL